MHQKSDIKPDFDLPKWFTPVFLTTVLIPFGLSITFTVGQIYPATITIEWLVDDAGAFPLFFTIVINFALLMIPIFLVLLLMLVGKKFFCAD